MIVHVGDEEDADRALVLRRQHLLDRHGRFGRDDAVERAVGIALTRLVLEDERDLALHPVAVVVVPERRRGDAEAGVDHRRLHRAAGAEALRVEILFGLQLQGGAVGEGHVEAAAVTERGDHQRVDLDERPVRRAGLQAETLEPRAHEIRGEGILRRAHQPALEAVPGQEEEIGAEVRHADRVVERRNALSGQGRDESQAERKGESRAHGYFVAAATLRSTVATVLSQAIESVAPVSLAFTNPIVSCSTDGSPVRTVIGARSTSNVAS